MPDEVKKIKNGGGPKPKHLPPDKPPDEEIDLDKIRRHETSGAEETPGSPFERPAPRAPAQIEPA